MKAVVLTMASIRQFDRHEDAFYVLDDQQKARVLEAIQQQQLSDAGMLIVIEGWANIQIIGPCRTLLSEFVQSQAWGTNPNKETLCREVIFYEDQGILGLRVTYTSSPLKRIVYDITTEGDIQVAHI